MAVAEDGLFAFFNEVGIIHQLASALFLKVLPDGVHIAHFAILNHMVRLGDDRTPVQLASAMQVTKPTMTHSLKVLESRGFVAIRADATDRRSKRVLLTAAGRRFRDDAIAAIEAGLAGIADRLDDGTLPETVQRLRKIRRTLDEAR
jgi:DNA-binding MarR family transcriptional regulator